MSFNKDKFLKEFTRSQAADEEIHQNILEGMNILGANSIVLMCAIIIASVGLNMNATAVIIGAMLISPLMGPITAIGYGVGTYNSHLIQKAFKTLIPCVLISIVTSTIYFSITPITTAGSEILSRTSPTIWDVIIAFVGGTVGMIGATRSKTSNVIPGVAIATALMPPLCTAGYGLANRSFSIFLGAGYLFLINCFFIITATFLVTKALHLPIRTHLDDVQQSKMKKYIIITSIIVIIPSTFSAFTMIKETVNERNINVFISKELENQYVLDKKINKHNNTISLVVMGEKLSSDEITQLNEKLPSYGFHDMHLSIKQDETNMSELDKYINELIQQNKNLMTNNAVQEKPKAHDKLFQEIDVKAITQEIKAIYPSIQDVYLGQVVNEANQEKELPIIILYTTDPALMEQQTTLEYWFRARMQQETVLVSIKQIAPTEESLPPTEQEQ